MNKQFILAIDQGTSGTKTLIFDEMGKVYARAAVPLKTYFDQNGFVEQVPEEILQNVLLSVEKCIKSFIDAGNSAMDIHACGITNQRETFIIWDIKGRPLYNGVVWQCKRSVDICERLKKEGLEKTIKQKTGLLIDPYFSGTKLIWLFENIEIVRTAIDRGDAFFGTVDTWLLYNLTKGKSYCTDHTNASRTLFFNLSTLTWDKDLLAAFGLSKLNLPECKPSAHFFGESDIEGLVEKQIPISSMIGDSHAAAFGENCFQAGEAKATLGTGCSILMNIGERIKYSDNGMVTTICWSTGDSVQYALEGVIVTCGASIEWLRNELGLIAESSETERMATSVHDNHGVYMIPAFSGLGAPHWDMKRKASIHGLTFSANKNHIVRAALESIPYQIKDVIVAMEADTQIKLNRLMIDGGISSNHFIVKFLADLLNKPVVNIGIPEVSALGAAYLAGITEGFIESIEHLSKLNADKKIYHPATNSRMDEYYTGWKRALQINIDHQQKNKTMTGQS